MRRSARCVKERSGFEANHLSWRALGDQRYPLWPAYPLVESFVRAQATSKGEVSDHFVHDTGKVLAMGTQPNDAQR